MIILSKLLLHCARHFETKVWNPNLTFWLLDNSCGDPIIMHWCVNRYYAYSWTQLTQFLKARQVSYDSLQYNGNNWKLDSQKFDIFLNICFIMIYTFTLFTVVQTVLSKSHWCTICTKKYILQWYHYFTWN